MKGNSNDGNRQARGKPATVGGRLPGRLASAPKVEQRLHVNVGIDFGTSSTKIIFGGMNLEPTYVCVFDDNPEGYSPVCYPSTVRIIDGRIFFGTDAERRTGGLVLRSFKVCMGCIGKDGRCLTCPNRLGMQKRAGLFDLGATLAGLIPAEEVAAWYLAHVVRVVSDRIAARFSRHQLELTFQTAAPVKSCDSSVEKMVFQRALELARRMAQDVEQGMAASELHEIYRRHRNVMDDEGGLPAAEASRTFVLPETHAALVAFIKSTDADNGLYSIIDVGAGTSDISFFRYFEDHDGHKMVSYYCSDVSRIGGDAIDQYIYEVHPCHEMWKTLDRSELLGRIRLAKQGLMTATLPGDAVIERSLVEQAAGVVATNIHAAYGKLWSSAWEKEKNAKAWGSYEVFLCGGGSRVGSTFPRVFSRVPKSAKNIVKTIRTRGLKLPSTLEPDHPTNSAISSFGFLLPVAYGVAFHWPTIPECILPSKVRPLVPLEAPAAPGWQENDHYGNW